MESAVVFDADAIRSAKKFGVERLRVFGSVLTDRFNPETSDIDFLLTFQPERDNLFQNYFDLKFELERIVGMRNGLAYEYGDIDYEVLWRTFTSSFCIHPFREGNGRTQRFMFSRIAHDAGWHLRWQAVIGEMTDRA